MSCRMLISWTAILVAISALLAAQPGEKNSPELVAKTFTLRDPDVSLSRALKELAKQTGNPVEDRRKPKDDPKLGLDLKDATFWQALDAIAREADARVSVYEQDHKIALLDGPFQALPVSYNGLFRVLVKRVDAVRFLETEAHYCTLYLDVAWEPRFQPFLLETQPESLTVQDEKGAALKIPEGGKGQAAVGRRNAIELELRVPAPRRSSAQFGLLKGTLSVIGPSKMVTFTFPKLSKIERKNDIRKETIEDVTVSLRRFLLEGEGSEQLWTAEVLLEYPESGPKFESFQSWLVNNEAYLERDKAGAKERFPVNGGYETDDATETKAILRYRFTDEPEKKLMLGKPGDWNFVYRTPGKIIELSVPFEFKDLPLP